MDPLAHFRKLKNDRKDLNNKKNLLITEETELTSRISSQHDVSDNLRKEHDIFKNELTRGIPDKAIKAANAAAVTPGFREEFILQVTEGLKKAVDYDLTSIRFQLIDSDNKLIQDQQRLGEVKKELADIDKELVKLDRKINSARIKVQSSLEKVEAQLCL